MKQQLFGGTDSVQAVLVMVLGGRYGVSIGRYWLVLGGAGSVLGDNGKFFIGLHLLKKTWRSGQMLPIRTIPVA